MGNGSARHFLTQFPIIVYFSVEDKGIPRGGSGHRLAPGNDQLGNRELALGKFEVSRWRKPASRVVLAPVTHGLAQGDYEFLIEQKRFARNPDNSAHCIVSRRESLLYGWYDVCGDLG